jgi:hypothetical protein
MPDTEEPVRHVWDGTTRSSSLTAVAAEARQRLADHAWANDWDGVFAMLAKPDYEEWVNASRPDSTSWYAPLHQAAYGGAPESVIRDLVDRGAWRGLRNASAERPLDIAIRFGHESLREVLTPNRVLDVPDGELRAIQDHFHDVIRGRVADLVDEHQLRLPELEVLLETPSAWFPVPGMTGGFSMKLSVDDGQTKLATDSWSRLVQGSGQRHEITADGASLVRAGFV